MSIKKTFTISNGDDLFVHGMEAKGFDPVDQTVASNIYLAAKFAKEKIGITDWVIIHLYNSDTIEIGGKAAFACYNPSYKEIHMAVGFPTQSMLDRLPMTEDEWNQDLYRRLFHEMYHQFQHQEGWSDKPDDFLEDEAERNAVELMQQYLSDSTPSPAPRHYTPQPPDHPDHGAHSTTEPNASSQPQPPPSDSPE